jgi:outer membrane lipopolysaccharide assembly protein LptE/RlpB
MLKQLIAILAILAVGGCGATANESPAQMQRATLTNPSSQIHAELQQALATLLGASNVLIADDAFTQFSQEVIERAQHKDANGLLIMGRSTEMPVTVQLLKQGDNCLLRHVQSGNTTLLSQARCAAEK